MANRGFIVRLTDEQRDAIARVDRGNWSPPGDNLVEEFCQRAVDREVTRLTAGREVKMNHTS